MAAPPTDAKFLRILEAALAGGLAQVQRELAAEFGEKKVKDKPPRARSVIYPTDTDEAAAKKAQLELKRHGVIPYGRKAG